MGNELAGVVEAAGEGVPRFAPGDKVYARMPKDRMGAFADYAVVPEDHLSLMPSSLDLETAAGVPLAGLTSLQALRDELKLKAGSRVFIPGGAGGVGTFAIQIAKWLGAEVTTARKDLGRGPFLAALFWTASLRFRADARKQGVTYRYLFMHPSGTELTELA